MITVMKTITPFESNAIESLRFVAMSMIVACHIVLSYGSKYYSVLNMGVQIFFVLSAFLYAQKRIDAPQKWLKKRILKLYPPFLLFVVFALPLLFAFRPEYFSLKKIVFYLLNCQYFLGKGQYDELDHLWFLTTIFICYLVTPLLQWISDSKYGRYSSVMVGAMMIVNYCTTNGKIDWLFLFAFSYLLFRLRKTVDRWVIAILLGLLSIPLIQINWVHILSVDWVRLSAFDICSLLIVILSLRIFAYFRFDGCPQVVKWISNYSFEIYIVHNFFIHGTFSCSYLTDSVLLNVCIILFVSITLAYVLRIMTKKAVALID